MKVLTAVKRTVSSACVQLWGALGCWLPSCRFPVLPLLLTALCLPTVRAEQLDLYVWPVTGVINVEHGEPSDGLAMEVMQAVLARMPDRDPRFRLGNRARLQRNMAAGANLCALPLLREPQGDDVGYFIPLFASTPIRVVMRRRQLERFPIESGRLSLTRLVSDSRLQGALDRARTYPSKLQGVLDQAVREGRILRVSASTGGENLLLMLKHGRFDYILEYASISHAVESRLGIGELLASVPIQEDAELSAIGIYCTRNAWGRAAAKRIDKAIRQVAAEPASLLRLHAKWLPGASYLDFAEDLEAFYLQRARQALEFD